ncbi:alpha-amylase family glycosyl hydrolase [Cystobacter fuscus]
MTSEVHTDAAVSVPVAASTPPARTVAPRPWSDEVLYFVVVDRFADGDPANNLQVDTKAPGTFHGGDFKGLREQLDELSSLGVTALWITPVVKNIDGFVTGAGFPDWGYHGYWAEDFQQLDPRFGSEQELKALVDAAHQRGIRVLLDVVYNHPGYDSRYQKDPRTSGWLRSQEQGTCGQDDVTSCVSGLPDFKTEVPEVAGTCSTRSSTGASARGWMASAWTR